MNAELNQHIDQLRQMTTAQLKLKYRELFGQPSHSNHKGYLFRRIAWRVQAVSGGDLSERAREYAREIAAEGSDGRLRSAPEEGGRRTGDRSAARALRAVADRPQIERFVAAWAGSFGSVEPFQGPARRLVWFRWRSVRRPP